MLLAEDWSLKPRVHLFPGGTCCKKDQQKAGTLSPWQPYAFAMVLSWHALQMATTQYARVLAHASYITHSCGTQGQGAGLLMLKFCHLALALALSPSMNKWMQTLPLNWEAVVQPWMLCAAQLLIIHHIDSYLEGKGTNSSTDTCGVVLVRVRGSHSRYGGACACISTGLQAGRHMRIDTPLHHKAIHDPSNCC